MFSRILTGHYACNKYFYRICLSDTSTCRFSYKKGSHWSAVDNYLYSTGTYEIYAAALLIDRVWTGHERVVLLNEYVRELLRIFSRILTAHCTCNKYFYKICLSDTSICRFSYNEGRHWRAVDNYMCSTETYEIYAVALLIDRVWTGLIDTLNDLPSLLHAYSLGFHTYMQNWSLHPYSQDYDQASHTTHVEC